MRPLEPQALKYIPFWGATFKFSLDVFLNTYDYGTGKQFAFGQIIRFQAANATKEGEVGSRVPSIWAFVNGLGYNQLQITSYIVTNNDPKGPGRNGPGSGSGPNNYEVNFEEYPWAPKPKEWFTITVSQRPLKVNKPLKGMAPTSLRNAL